MSHKFNQIKWVAGITKKETLKRSRGLTKARIERKKGSARERTDLSDEAASALERLSE
jgi:hypothetical protein